MIILTLDFKIQNVNHLITNMSNPIVNHLDVLKGFLDYSRVGKVYRRLGWQKSEAPPLKCAKHKYILLGLL